MTQSYRVIVKSAQVNTLVLVDSFWYVVENTFLNKDHKCEEYILSLSEQFVYFT